MGTKFFPIPKDIFTENVIYPHSATIAFQKRGTVTSQFHSKKKKNKRDRLLRREMMRHRRQPRGRDPALYQGIIGPSLSEFTGLRPGRRWAVPSLPGMPRGFYAAGLPHQAGGEGGLNSNSTSVNVANRAINQSNQAFDRITDEYRAQQRGRDTMVGGNMRETLSVIQNLINAGVGSPSQEIRDVIASRDHRYDRVHQALLGDPTFKSLVDARAGPMRQARLDDSRARRSSYALPTHSRAAAVSAPRQIIPIGELMVSTDDIEVPEETEDIESKEHVRDTTFEPGDIRGHFK